MSSALRLSNKIRIAMRPSPQQAQADLYKQAYLVGPSEIAASEITYDENDVLGKGESDRALRSCAVRDDCCEGMVTPRGRIQLLLCRVLFLLLFFLPVFRLDVAAEAV
jgi:hypothetical protein